MVGKADTPTEGRLRPIASLPHLKIASVPPVEIAPVERRYICGVNAVKLFYQRFCRIDTAPQCVVLLIHGFGEHVGRFSHVISEFVAAGADLHTIDLRGHGLSGGARADGHFDDFISDIGQLHRVAVIASPNLPVFVYGQSMGGMLALAYALNDSEHRIRGVISTSPWLRLTKKIQPSWWKLVLLKVGWPLFEEFLISSNVDPCSLSSVDGVASAAINDRLVLPFMTVRMAFQIITGAKQTLDNAHRIKTPILVIHGGSDQLTCAQASLQFVDSAGSDDKSIRIFEQAYHEIHNDVDRSLMFNEAKDWMAARCATQFAPEFMLERDSRSASMQLDMLDNTIQRSRLTKRLSLLAVMYFIGVFISYWRRHGKRASILWPVRVFLRLISKQVPKV